MHGSSTSLLLQNGHLVLSLIGILNIWQIRGVINVDEAWDAPYDETDGQNKLFERRIARDIEQTLRVIFAHEVD